MGAENFTGSSFEGSAVENQENDNLTLEVKEDLNAVTTGVESNPTVEGIKDAIRDFATAIQEGNTTEARATMLRLRAYASADLRMRRGIEAAIGNMTVGGISLTQKIASIDDIEGLNHTPDALKYAVMLYLNLQGYYLTDKNFDTLPLYHAVQEYRAFVTTRDTYTTKYSLSAAEATEKATFAYPSLEELATDYELLASSSRGVLDGWLRAAGQAPVVQKLYAQKTPLGAITDILDKDTTNDLQEQMFVYLYKSVQQRVSELSDEASAQYKEGEFQKAQATAPEGVTYVKTTLDQVTISASGPKKLPSLQGDLAQGKELIMQPGSGYTEAILLHINSFIDQRNKAPEIADLEGQLAQLGVAIDRLITAADVADPEKKSEGIDEHLSYAVESKILSLYDLSGNNSDARKELQELVTGYITTYLFSHTTQIERFVTLVGLLDGKQQAAVMLAYAQLEPNLDPSVVQHIAYLIDFDVAPTNSDKKYASPLALGPIDGGLKQLGEGALENFNNLDQLGLNELGTLYTNLLQVTSGKKIDGTTWDMPLLEKTPPIFGDGINTLLPEQKDLFISGDVSLDNISVASWMQEHFIDPRTALVLHVQDVYLEKLQTELESNDEGVRTQALNFALSVLNTSTENQVDYLLQASFLEGVAGVLFQKHTTIDKKVAQETLEKFTPQDIVHATFEGQDGYETMKNTSVRTLIADIDDALFTSLVGADKTTFLNNAGDSTLEKLNMVDQMLVYSMSVCGSDPEKVQSLLSVLTLNSNMFFASVLEANGDKIFSLNQAGFTAQEKLLYTALGKRGVTDLADLYTKQGYTEMGFRMPAGLLRRLKPIGRRASRSARPAIKRFVTTHGTYDKIVNVFIGRTRKQRFLRGGMGAFFYGAGSMMEKSPEKDRVFDKETLCKTTGFIISIPGAVLAMGVKEMLGFGYDDRHEDTTKELDNLEPPKQVDHTYVEWVVTEYSDHKVQKGVSNKTQLDLRGKDIPLVGLLVEGIESATESLTLEELGVEATIRVKPIFDQKKLSTTIKQQGFDEKVNSEKVVKVELPNPAFEITFSDRDTFKANDAFLKADGSAQKNLEGAVQKKLMAEALLFCLTGQIKDKDGQPRTLASMRETYRKYVIEQYVNLGFKEENIQVTFVGEDEYDDPSKNMNIDRDLTEELMKDTKFAPLFKELRAQYEDMEVLDDSDR